MADDISGGNGQDDENFQSAFSEAGQVTETESVAAPVPDVVAPPLSDAPTVTETPPVAATPAIETPPAPQANPLHEYAESFGVTPTGMSDEQIWSTLKQQAEQQKAYASYGQQIMPYADQIREYFDRSREPEPEPQPEDEWTPDGYFGDLWKSTEVDPQLNFAVQQGYVVRDPNTGAFAPAPGSELIGTPVATQLNETEALRRQQWETITNGNPYRTFYDKLQPAFERQWQSQMEEFFSEKMAAYQQEQQQQQFISQNYEQLFTKDATGNDVPTEYGQKLSQEINTLRQAGVTDPDTLLSLAQRMAQPPQTAQPAATPAAPAQQPAPTAAPQQSFLQNALDSAMHSPNSGGHTTQNPGTEPVNVSEGELNSMFVNANQSQSP